jgi:hypothetical protein
MKDYKDAIWIVCDLINAASADPVFMEYFLKGNDNGESFPKPGLMQAMKLIKLLAEAQEKDTNDFINDIYRKV